jgi:cell division protein FtsW
MTPISRTDTSLVGCWWWTVDRWTVAALLAIVAAGAVLTLAASPPVAERLNFDTFYFAKRQFAILPVALALMFGVSLLSPLGVRRLAIAGFVTALALTALAAFAGFETKGAARWLKIGAFSLQPSEFVKPTFAVVAAWMFAAWRLRGQVAGHVIAVVLYAVVITVLLAQPDVGMAILVSLVWGVQFFLAGLPMLLVAAIGVLFVAGGVGAYFAFDHVQTRVDRFIDPAGGEAYQVQRSLEAFANGGLFGRGPGEGQVKAVLPDAHADFVFAVVGEEFGMIAALVIVGLFAFVVLRGFARALQETDLFVQLAVAGLLVQFGLQAIINMASTVNLMPTKGMTLPFISYGGSSMLALAIGMGMVLALTRTRPVGAVLAAPRMTFSGARA